MNRISKGVWLCIALFCICFKPTYGGTAVDFSVSPAVIVESLTKSVQMHCAVNDLSKRAWSTNATEDVDHVVSITVANDDGTIIAKVAENVEASVENDKGGLTATGSASGNAHLDLTFASPSEMDMGVYKCNVLAISTSNRHMWLGRTVNAKTRPATVPDLVNEIKMLENKTTALEKITRLIDVQTKSEIEAKSHIESGYGHCARGRAAAVKVTFNKAFKTPPRVFVAASRASWGYIGKQHISFDIYPSNITTTGFNMYCGTMNGDYINVPYLVGRWLAHP